MNVVPIRAPFYEAKSFSAGCFEASGTLCGHVDFATPRGTYVLSPDEVLAVIAMLHSARSDVLNNSDPNNDPRIVKRDS